MKFCYRRTLYSFSFFHLVVPMKYFLPLTSACHMHTLPSEAASVVSINVIYLLQGRLTSSHIPQIHARIYRLGENQNNAVITRLIGRYPARLALRGWQQLELPSILTSNDTMRVLINEGLFSQALILFKTLKERSISPNDLTFTYLLKVCTLSDNAHYVKQVHAQIIKTGVANLFIWQGLIVSYLKVLKDLVSGHRIFDEIADTGMICSWTSMIDGYAKLGKAGEALQLFLLMATKNVCPEDDTLVSILSACSRLDDFGVQKWVSLFSEFVRENTSNDLLSAPINTVLAYLYGRLGRAEKSRDRFDLIGKFRERSVLPWNVMIDAYVKNDCALDALNIFRIMICNCNSKPNHVTMVGVLSACAEIGDLDLGQWVHDYIKLYGRKGVLKSNKKLATSLMDMYSKCGYVERAKEVFDEMDAKDTVALNAMIMGHAINGDGQAALELFGRISELQLCPNAGTFLSVLCACNHCGYVVEGRKIFLNACRCSSILLKLEHYACYIDLLSRTGLIEEALQVVISMPYKPSYFVWGALLSGCLLHRRIDLVQDVSKKLVEVDPDNSAGYVLLSNAFAVDARWHDAAWIRLSMKGNGVGKHPGCSWTKVNGIVHEFFVGSVSHPQIVSIKSMLDDLLREMKMIQL